MNPPPFLQATPNGCHLALKVQPRASNNEIGNLDGPELRLRVTAPPVDDAANEAVIRLLAETLDCPRSAIQIVRGRTSRHKIVLVQGLTPQTLLARLSPPRPTPS